MRILSIDTSTMLGSVALSDGDIVLAQEQQGVPATHAHRLFGSISHILSVAGCALGDIEAIAVAIGPGSFTGLRIGLAAAKGLSLGLGCPIAGVSSLRSLALNVADFPGTAVAIIDARRGELYAAAWSCRAKGKGRAALSPGLFSPKALIGRLKAIDGEMRLVGDGALAYGRALKAALGHRASIASSADCLPRAANLAALALPRLRRGKGDDLAALVPNYIRRSDAEIGFRGRA